MSHNATLPRATHFSVPHTPLNHLGRRLSMTSIPTTACIATTAPLKCAARHHRNPPTKTTSTRSAQISSRSRHCTTSTSYPSCSTTTSPSMAHYHLFHQHHHNGLPTSAPARWPLPVSDQHDGLPPFSMPQSSALPPVTPCHIKVAFCRLLSHILFQCTHITPAHNSEESFIHKRASPKTITNVLGRDGLLAR